MTRRTLLQAAVLARPAPRPALAITMDDFNWAAIPAPFGPVANRTLLDTLEAHGVKAALFAIGGNVDQPQGRTLLEAWNEAGHLIGNHTYSHRNYSSLNAAEFSIGILRCDEVLKPYSQYTRYFRFPLLKEGNTAEKRDLMRAFLKDNGFHNGHVTIDASDWFYNAELTRHLAENAAYDVGRFRGPYLAHLWDRAQYYDRLARAVTNRSPSHTLLVHYNLINVLFLGDALQMFKEKNWRLISAREAYRDPIFRAAPRTVPAGESLVWALARESGRFDGELRYPGEDGVYEMPKVASL
ncbi:MAG: polysaccharide deacetylase family protein [Acidobacteriota bacterium]|nr:polysaccharide deacetylase family protein [Acidobacteriota bacterium]